MATKVHDQGDDQDFSEIDTILAQAKLGLRRDRCREHRLRRNTNLSDIPENSTHEPSNETTAFAASQDTSQPEITTRDGHKRLHQRLQILSFIAPMKWLRAYMGCMMAVHDDNYDVARVMKRTRMMGELQYPAHSSRQ
ncbi:uncharacterized protein [Physcomitrium patens]|uniref:Uncharacterized protein n=1 Tax=Physcomitrium patens TaxID=3218 RepID=A9RQX3_PHYPA|nr:hypothetical protein PHYPA_003406 [Physcomitrium patens]